MSQEKRTSKPNTSVRSDFDDIRRDRDSKPQPLASTEEAGRIRVDEPSSQPKQSILIPGQDF